MMAGGPILAIAGGSSGDGMTDGGGGGGGGDDDGVRRVGDDGGSGVVGGGFSNVTSGEKTSESYGMAGDGLDRLNFGDMEADFIAIE